jgi:creatinine amidohydrolase
MSHRATKLYGAILPYSHSGSLMELALSTWPEVAQYLAKSTGIIIPIGSTEQHGPTGLIGTDALTANGIAIGVGKATNALVAPPINVGMALHHMAFPGTISLRPSTLALVVRDYLVSLSKAGFTKFFFINGHGGNMATVKAAFSETYAHLEDIQAGYEIHCHLANWFMGGAVYRLAKELYGDQEGSHATPSEVAVTQYLYPDSIKTAYLAPLVSNSGHGIYSATDFRKNYPDGRMGSNPGLATPEHGQRFFEAAVAELTTSYQNFIGGL